MLEATTCLLGWAPRGQTTGLVCYGGRPEARPTLEAVACVFRCPEARPMLEVGLGGFVVQGVPGGQINA